MRLPHLFQEAEHAPFTWTGGVPAALMVHGFPGTPAEMRPLARSLHQAGWTVHGILLPGFGPQIDTLFERRSQEWVTAVQEALAGLARRHHPILLVGHSMGGAIAIRVAAHEPPAGLVLLAPFLRLDGEGLYPLLWPVLKHVLRRVRPFKNTDFSDPQVRRGAGRLLPGVDLDDSGVQSLIRDLTVPAGLIDQVVGLGRVARRLAPQVNAPVLVIQGTDDQIARPVHTRRLLQRLPGPIRYREVSAQHDLLEPGGPDWPLIERAVLEMAHELAAEETT